MRVAYFDHRQTIQTHFKLKPYYFLRMVAHVYILSSLGTEAKRQEIVFLRKIFLLIFLIHPE